MNRTSVTEARKLAYEFIELASRALLDEKEDATLFIGGSLITGALRRKSMDLTRALARMRRNG